MNVELVEYSKSVKDTVTSLEVASWQKDFVDSNAESLLEFDRARMNGHDVRAFVILEGNVACGFAMILHSSRHPENPRRDCPWYLWRFMIDENFQGRGIGRKALGILLEYMEKEDTQEAFACSVSYEDENQVARKLYSSFGFKETGDIVDGETVAILK